MDKYFAKLNEKQKQAVTYLEGPLLVLAGPGTGKTQLLSSRVAYILQNTDTAPENILCITFTEAGVSNMRERLSTIVGKDSAKINISTYHAFGQNILNQYGNYSETYTRKLEKPIDNVTKQKIIRELQAKLPANDILRGDDAGNIVNSISAAKAARLEPKDIAKIAEQNAVDSEILDDIVSPYLQKITPYKFHPTLEDAYEPIYEILKSHVHDAPIMSGIARIIQPLAASLELAIDEAKVKDSVKSLTSWRDANYEKDGHGNWHLSNRIANKKLASLANIMELYQNYLVANHLFDFDDMIEDAVTVLQKDAGFRMTMSERYQFILLDEFQDTNPSQFEIIKQLTDYENPMIMAVGDDDQAIYEFQGASATSLSVFKNHYNAHVINLTENYRSTQEILDFSARIIDQVPDSFIKTQPELGLNKNLHANRPPLDHSGITRHEFLSAEAEYYWVANRIANLINAGVKQTDIAVIVPKHKYILPLLPYLKSHPEINIAYEKRDNLFEDPEIHEIITCLELIYNISNQKSSAHLLPEVLGYDFWRISPIKVFRALSIAEQKHTSALDYLTESQDEDLAKVANFLATVAIRSYDAPLELIIDYVIGTAKVPNLDYISPFFSYHTADDMSYDSFKLYNSLSVLRKKIEEHIKTERPKLADFMEFIEDYRIANQPLASSSPYQDAADSIQILSAHSSKGLEFEYVFLIAVDDLSWGKSKGNSNALVLPKNVEHIHHVGSTDGERIRLLFVAATRAKSYLTMTSSIKDFAGKTPKHLYYLGEYTDENGTLISPLLPEETRAVQTYYEDLDEARKQTDLRASWISSYLSPTPDIRLLLEKRLENYHLSATNLTSFVNLAYGGPIEFFKNTIMRSPSEPTNTSMSYGTVVHKAFERITKEGITDEEAVNFFREEIAKENLSTEEIEELSEKGARSLEIALKDFGEIIRDPNSKAEIDFRGEHLRFDNVPLTGKIDHVCINEAEKTIEIYDFKTGKYYSTKNWWGEAKLIAYLIQLNFYKLLIENSPTYSKYRVTRGHILFTEPDKNDIVYDKVYEYNDADYDKVKKLVKSVYNHIKLLDFIEPGSPLAIEKDQNSNYKDMITFIDKLVEEA